MSEDYGWAEEDAVEFILCDTEPIIHLEAKPREWPRAPGVANVDIILTCPLWVTEKQVMDAWRQAREEVFRRRGTAGVTKVTDRWVDVARFVYISLDAEGKAAGGWQALCDRLNVWLEKRGRADWKFGTAQQLASNFLRFDRLIFATRADTDDSGTQLT